MTPSFLQPTPPTADRVRLEQLEIELIEREAELGTLKLDLQGLQARYLERIGGLYRQLSDLEAALADEEIRAGLRSPPVEIDDDSRGSGAGQADSVSCTSRPAPTDDLKRVFRDLAKAVHPDLAIDESARYRRHSLMAEANRAYAERDADRLRLILRRWEQRAEAVADDGPDAEAPRVARKIAEIEERFGAIEAELADLRGSAIHRLKGKIDEARAQGWDLFAEMVLQVKTEITRARAKLASLRRSPAASNGAALRSPVGENRQR